MELADRGPGIGAKAGNDNKNRLLSLFETGP
jgi:hypothetical protein